MLAALNFGGVLLGVAAGGFAASVGGLLVGSVLSLMGADWGADVGLIFGVTLGLAVAGWIAGRKAAHSGRFHGSVAGLLLAFVIMVIARLGGSSASTPSLLWLAVLSMVIGGGAGWWSHRSRSVPG